MPAEPLLVPEPTHDTWDVNANQKWKSFIQEFTSPHDADAIEWTRLDQIISLLGRLGQEFPHEHWVFLPGGEGLQIARTSVSSEPGCMQIEAKGEDVLTVCRPLSLMCVWLRNDPDHSYFDLELGRLRHKGRTTGPGDFREDWSVKVLSPDGSEAWTDHSRLLHGRLVIMSKGCPYNLDPMEPQHDTLSRNLFRKCMEFPLETDGVPDAQ